MRALTGTGCTRAPAETTWRCVRDVLRALVWVLCGFTGDGIAALVHENLSAMVNTAGGQTPV